MKTLLLFMFCLAVSAEDITFDGKTYRECEIVEKTKRGITVRHSAGVATIRAEKMSPEQRKEYGVEENKEVSVVAASAALMADNISYRGATITEAQYIRLWSYYQSKLYKDTRGKIYDCYSPETSSNLISMPPHPGVGCAGEAIYTVTGMSGKVQVVLKHEKKIVNRWRWSETEWRTGEEIKTTTDQAVLCDELAGAAISGRQERRLVAIPETANVNGETLPVLVPLSPISQPEFKLFLSSGGILYKWFRSVIPAEYTNCELCGGKGQVRNSDIDNAGYSRDRRSGKKLESQSVNNRLGYSTCPKCEGKKRFLAEPEKVSWEKRPVE